MKAKPKKRANRPNRIEFSDEKLETIRGLGYIHCTLREAAAVLGLDESVVLQWHAQFPNHPFTRKFEEGKAAGKTPAAEVPRDVAKNVHGDKLARIKSG